MLTSRQNSLVKQIRTLHKSKERRSQGMFLLEGTHLIQEALPIGLPIEVICYTEAWQDQHDDLLVQLGQTPARLELVSPDLLKYMSTTVEPDGVLAVAPSQQQKSLKIKTLGLVLETIQDPGNLGTMIRTAAAAGVDGVLLSRNCADLENPKTLRATAGQWLKLPIGTSEDLVQDLQAFKAQGIQIVATIPTADQTYWEIDLQRPSVILLGNEGGGLSPEVAAMADVTVTIPLASGVESLNVAIAAALMLYEVKRQRA
jgi:RNA methyltransferase, TrmH family